MKDEIKKILQDYMLTDLPLNDATQQVLDLDEEKWIDYWQKVEGLINAFEKYIEALGNELNETSIIAHTHGWRSTRYEEGVNMRDEIASAKSLLLNCKQQIKT